MKKRFSLSLVLFAVSMNAIQIPVHHFATKTPGVKAPWFTGPLLAPSGLTIPAGHYNIEPYVYATANTGQYTSNWKRVKTDTFWANIFQPSFQFGLNKWLDFQFNPTLSYNYKEGAAKWVIGDMPIGFDIQLFKRTASLTSWNTALKLALKETLPIGKYRNLNPKKLLTDVGGQGTWQTSVGLVWGNLFYLGGDTFLTWRTAWQYSLPAPVHVKNLNVYGGGPGTKGTVYPAQGFLFDTAIEINMNQNWAFAMDIVGNWLGKTRFKGDTSVKMTSPPSVQFSLAPALEYNWSANLGMIFGCWFTVAGRNSTQFTSGVLAINYYN